MSRNHTIGSPYVSDHLSHIAFPLGGIGAGMLCLEGTGGLSNVSLRHRPEVFNDPLIFAALCIQGDQRVARVLEGPVPTRKIFGQSGCGNGSQSKFGLPRFSDATFTSQFPFATVSLADALMPLTVELTGWSPFIPGDADNSSLPVAMLEYRFSNPTEQPVDAVFSFHAANFLAVGEGARGVKPSEHGFVIWQDGTSDAPWHAGALMAEVEDDATVDCRWFRGKWFDAVTVLWQQIAAGAMPANAAVSDATPSPGASLYVPFTLAPGEERCLRLRLCWYVPVSDLHVGEGGEVSCCSEGCSCAPAAKQDRLTHRPWYAGRFSDIDALSGYWAAQAGELRARTSLFSDTFFDSTLPAEVLDAVASNLAILKSPTVLRQTDGRLWCFEGCGDNSGCCHGSCTHVWNYAQAVAHLFPDLERSLRDTEFNECQDARGHQVFRADLPIRPQFDHSFHAAADGQLGGIMKVYRDWRISGATDWLRQLWPQVRQSLQFCIDAWDPEHEGWLVEPHHNTYDIEFWGPDGMCTSIYLGALVAAVQMASALGEEAELFSTLAVRARERLESDLFNGEYFVQQVRWEGLHAGNPVTASAVSFGGEYSSEALELLQLEGPKYQYGTGCLSDGILGVWLAEMCGLGDILAKDKVTSHLRAVHQYNLRHDLSTHANPQRPGYALGNEGGLLLCSWPHGGALTLPFVYSDEVWTGIEYQVASHLISTGHLDEGLDIVRTARSRYDGRVRNPFNEYECGHWYARALSSYALLYACSGARYDALEQRLYLSPQVKGDFRAFICTAGGYGVVGMRDGEPFLEVKSGAIPVQHIVTAKPMVRFLSAIRWP